MRKSFTKDILEVAIGPIIAISIPIERLDDYYTQEDPRNEIIDLYGGKTISWELAEPLLNYVYDNGFGAMDCHNIVAWTESQVIFIHEYDGATDVRTLPRNPEPLNN